MFTSRFSDYFSGAKPRLVELAGLTSPLRPLGQILETAQAARGLSAEDVASLICWGSDFARREEIHDAARALRERVGGRTVEIIIPAYLTSFCQNDCLYCGYRESNALAERVRLSLSGYERELDLILAWGHRQIELVLSDDPEFTADQLTAYVQLTRHKLAGLGGGMLALNAPAYREESYLRLNRAGLDWVALWQETYDEAHFNRWHSQGSPKREYAFRLEVWDRVISGGFSRVALGVLFGLYHWRFDVLALAEHANYLLRTYGVEPHAFGIPRLKPARGVLASQKPSRFSVSDDEFNLAISIFRLAFPRTRLFFNTRETYEFNMSMVARGDLFTVDCETLPGAYWHGSLPGQFATHHYPGRNVVKANFARKGYGCRYLEPEDQRKLAAIGSPANQIDFAESLRGLSADRDEVRLRLNVWEKFLESMCSTPVYLRRVAARELHEHLRFFESEYVAHCREEEKVIERLQGVAPLDRARAAQVFSDHERFAFDLDRFQRQIISYEQSGDPTALLTVGSRMIAELRNHLDRAGGLLSQSLATKPGTDHQPLA